MGLRQNDWRLYLDANFFIEAVEGQGASSKSCWRLLSAGEKRHGLLATSLLTLSEVLVLPLREGHMPVLPGPFIGKPLARQESLASEYADIITDAPRLSVVEINRDILIGAAHIRSQWHAGKLPDAIHLATAQVLQCTHMISADKKLSAAAAERFDMTAVAPSDIEAILSDIEAGR